MSTTAYPLSWPEFYPRTRRRSISAFKTPSFSKARDDLVGEVKRLGGKGFVLSTNIPIRQDGLPYASFKVPSDPGVAVYFTYKGKEMVFACDRWVRIEENIKAIFKTIEAMRGIERWGASDMLDRAFAGFLRLEAPKPESIQSLLGISEGATIEQVRAAYRDFAKREHPDIKGVNFNSELWAKVKIGYDDFISRMG